MEAFHTLYSTGIWTILFLYTAFRFVRCVRLVPQRKAYIVERLGKYHTTLGPGFHVLIPYLDRIAFIQDLREEAIEVPPQECFTKDNVRIEVDGIVYISVINSENASYGITDYRFAAIQLAQTTTRSVVGTLELDRTFEERDEVNSRVVGVLAEVGNAWGIQVHRYEVKNIVPPPTVRDAMERQMAAERDRRAVLAKAEGEMRSRINESEGQMKEMINRSEGEKQRRINEAQGRAEEILAVAKATAESIEKIGAALSRPGGVEATNLRLSQQLVSQLGNLASGKHSVLLPSDLASVEDVLKSVSLDGPTNGLVRTDDRTLPSTPAS
ncbi:MAG: stomatin-like protein [Deltaproteobacteria bacterium]